MKIWTHQSFMIIGVKINIEFITQDELSNANLPFKFRMKKFGNRNFFTDYAKLKVQSNYSTEYLVK